MTLRASLQSNLRKSDKFQRFGNLIMNIFSNKILLVYFAINIFISHKCKDNACFENLP